MHPLIPMKISELKYYVDDTPTRIYESQEVTKTACPQLLFGLNNYSTKTEILDSIPPRNVVDRLVSKFFTSFDVGPVILHRKTFLKEVSYSIK